MSEISPKRRRTVGKRFATRLGGAGVVMAAVFLLTAAPAFADCPVTDLTCVPGAAADPVTAVTDATTEVAAVASSAVDQATQIVDETVATVQDQAGQTADSITATVNRVLGHGVGPLPDPGAELPIVGDPSGDQTSGPGATSPSSSSSGSAGGGASSTSSHGAVAGLVVFGGGPVIGPVPGPVSSVPVVSSAIPQQGLFDRIGSAAIQAAKALAFPLALTLIVLLFVMVQNRIDRKDPKLALAPIAPDLLRFE
jgi:hypothetical protein